MNRVEGQCRAYGSYVVSAGTLRPQDILNSILDTLKEINPEGFAQVMHPATGFSVVPAYAIEDETSEWWDSEEAILLVDTLSDALNEAAPDGFHFCVNEGDSSCFGFWRLEDAETVWN